MIAIIGAGALVIGLISGFLLFADIDGGLGLAEWMHSVLYFFFIIGVIPGIIAILIGIGIILG